MAENNMISSGTACGQAQRLRRIHETESYENGAESRRPHGDVAGGINSIRHGGAVGNFNHFSIV